MGKKTRDYRDVCPEALPHAYTGEAVEKLERIMMDEERVVLEGGSYLRHGVAAHKAMEELTKNLSEAEFKELLAGNWEKGFTPTGRVISEEVVDYPPARYGKSSLAAALEADYSKLEKRVIAAQPIKFIRSMTKNEQLGAAYGLQPVKEHKLTPTALFLGTDTETGGSFWQDGAVTVLRVRRLRVVNGTTVGVDQNCRMVQWLMPKQTHIVAAARLGNYVRGALAVFQSPEGFLLYRMVNF